MGEAKEQYLSLAEIRALLEREERDRGALNNEQKYSLSHAQTFARLPVDRVTKLVQGLMGVEMMTLGNAYKLPEVLAPHRGGAPPLAGDRTYVGKDPGQRSQILHVKRRVGFEELTTAAQNELPLLIAEIVREKEERFVRYFNAAQAITTRFHMLELLPGLGKKTMWAILEERKKGPFKSLDDLAKRVPMVHHPEKLVAKRIEMEVADPMQKYRLFAAR